MPGTTRLLLERFSPYFDEHERYGIEIRGPARFYELIYPLERERLMQIAYEFQYHVDLPENPYIPLLHQRVRELWMDRKFQATLTLYRGAGFIAINDRRPGLPQQDLTLSGTSAQVYLACDAGLSFDALAQRFGDQASPEDLRGLLSSLVAKRLMYVENETYLSLAVAHRPVLAYEEVPPPSLELPSLAVAR